MTTNKLPGKITVLSIESIFPYDANAKIHDTKQVQKIAKSISQFGWDQPIVVDKDGVIIKGHGRRLAAISLGLKTVPVWVRDDLTPDQVKASRIADNRVAISDIDNDILQKELSELVFDMDGIFDKKELDFFQADLGEFNADAFVDDVASEVTKQAEENLKKVEEVDAREVKIEKALGFKTIKGSDERDVVQFMAQIEAEYGCEGQEAFMAFVKKLIEE